MTFRPLIFAALLLLAACGFEPVYGTHGETQALFGDGQVAVLPIIGGREGQLLRAAIEDAINPAGVSTEHAPWRLAVSLEKSVTPIAIDPDGTISRYNLHLTAHLQLAPSAGGEPSYTDSVRRISSYNVSESDFSSFIASRDATERGLAELAQDVRLRLSAWLAKQKAAIPVT